MNSFIKYPSLVNSSDFVRGHYSRWKDSLTQVFYATEKLHGSNFSIYYDGVDITFGRRTSFLLGDEELFNHKSFFDTFDFSFVKAIYDNNSFEQVIVYGEFYGQGIQKMEYQENLEGTKNFKIFNVFGQVSTDTFTVFGYEEMVEAVGVEKTVPYESKGNVWALLETLDLEKESHLGGGSEGYVLQPYDTRTFVVDNHFYGIKHKTAAFSETKVVFNTSKIKAIKIMEQLENYVTANRLNNVISKGEIAPMIKNLVLLMEAMIDDILQEFQGEIKTENIAAYKNSLKRSVAILIKKELNS